MVAASTNLIVVNAASGIADLADYLARARRTSLDYGSAGVGTTGHLTAAMLTSASGATLIHVPYRSSPGMVTDLLAGRLQSAILSPAAVLPHLPEGRMRVLATTGNDRFALLPGVPTVAESGFPGFEADPWYGVWGPAGLSDAVAERLGRHFGEVLGEPAIRQRLLAQGIEPRHLAPAALGALLAADRPRWAAAVAASGAVAE